jgi:hypothetical protein
MDSPHSSLNLLSHFDPPPRPTTPPRSEPSTSSHAAARVPSRGIGWVLAWSTALAILGFVGCQLIAFSYCLAAERSLARAARSAALEATLPRATYDSVVQIVERRLEPAIDAGKLLIIVQQDGLTVRDRIQAVADAKLSVTLAVPTRQILPQWLQAVMFWQSDRQIEVRAERRMPGRRLARH